MKCAKCGIKFGLDNIPIFEKPVDAKQDDKTGVYYCDNCHKIEFFKLYGN